MRAKFGVQKFVQKFDFRCNPFGIREKPVESSEVLHEPPYLRGVFVQPSDTEANFSTPAPRIKLESLLRRYEWLTEFVMVDPQCARQDEQQELLRRTELLRERLGIQGVLREQLAEVSQI